MGYPPGHWVGGDLSDAGGLPFARLVDHRRRSAGAAFLRHPYHAGPAARWAGLADRVMSPTGQAARSWPGGACSSALILGTFVQAALGLPVLRIS